MVFGKNKECLSSSKVKFKVSYKIYGWKNTMKIWWWRFKKDKDEHKVQMKFIFSKWLNTLNIISKNVIKR